MDEILTQILKNLREQKERKKEKRVREKTFQP